MSVLTPWMEPAATGLSSLNNADPLSPLETTTLRDYVNRFVRGLYDKSVMQEAIGQSVLISDSLRSAFEIVQRAGSIQVVKTDIARQDARDAKITLMEAYIQRQSGCLASEELSRAYISCRLDLSMFGEAHRRLVPVDTLESYGPITALHVAPGHSRIMDRFRHRASLQSFPLCMG
ncbi:hypothetical protein E4U48_000869 [Claviceps purpurea]|nr:hypothetical protein E4U48_000869 [Claviceps purpurea]